MMIKTKRQQRDSEIWSRYKQYPFTSCKRCGEGDKLWKQVDGDWILIEGPKYYNALPKVEIEGEGEFVEELPYNEWAKLVKKLRHRCRKSVTTKPKPKTILRKRK